jgi:chaperonin GroES
MSKKLKPLGDRIFVKAQEGKESKTKSGIILGEHATHGQKVYGTVAAVGTGIYTQNGSLIPITVNVGDEVMYHKGHGEDLDLDGEKYLIFKEHELIAYVSE